MQKAKWSSVVCVSITWLTFGLEKNIKYYILICQHLEKPKTKIFITEDKKSPASLTGANHMCASFFSATRLKHDDKLEV